MSSNRTLHVTPSGLRPLLVDLAPDPPNTNLSKRHPLIEHEDRELDSNMGELDHGTRARNRAFQERLDEIRRSASGFEAVLRTEARDAVESITDMREEYAALFVTYEKSLRDEIRAIYDKFDLELLPACDKKLDVIETNKDVFLKETVPAAIEQQSGEVSRRLKKEYETFDIEKQKERKRELKIVTNANEHIRLTAQKFTDEEALMAACFSSLEDDIVETERRSARMAQYHWGNALKDIAVLQAKVREEGRLRTAEDVDLLDTVIETQKLLQVTVIEHFGSGKEEPPEERKFPKLEEKMRRLSSRQEQEESKD